MLSDNPLKISDNPLEQEYIRELELSNINSPYSVAVNPDYYNEVEVNTITSDTSDSESVKIKLEPIRGPIFTSTVLCEKEKVFIYRMLEKGQSLYVEQDGDYVYLESDMPLNNITVTD